MKFFFFFKLMLCPCTENVQTLGLPLNSSAEISGLLVSERRKQLEIQIKLIIYSFSYRSSCPIFPGKRKEKDAPFNIKGMQILIFILCVLLLVAVQLEMHMELVVQLDLFYN